MTLTIHDIEQRSPEWYAARRGILTASTVHALLTVAKPSAIAYTCPSCDALPGDPCQSKRAPGGPLKTLHPERATIAAETDADPIVSVSPGDESRSLALLLAAGPSDEHARVDLVSGQGLRRRRELRVDDREPPRRVGVAAVDLPVLAGADARQDVEDALVVVAVHEARDRVASDPERQGVAVHSDVGG